MREQEENKLVEVCDKCLTASCWYGEFMCDEADCAGTIFVTVSELRKDNREDEYYWSDVCMEKIYGSKAPFGFGKKKQEVKSEC